ncbi:MAG: guanylate kinase [Alphaproteobacteria bacterium]|nr:guanylate kinase [Alphaproteobacteria bacterium]
MTDVKRRGVMLVLSSPSGAGKTTISRRLLGADQDLKLSVSVTTRAPRSGEVDGVDYHFIDRTRFDRLVADGAMLEHAEVFGHCYGTPATGVEDRLAAGKDVLFDIDWQGTQQLMRTARADLATIFILPPSVRELERRLHIRAQDSDAVVRHRMEGAGRELDHWQEYDYIVINDDLDRAINEVRSILTAERLRRERQVGVAAYVGDLRRGG